MKPHIYNNCSDCSTFLLVIPPPMLPLIWGKHTHTLITRGNNLIHSFYSHRNSNNSTLDEEIVFLKSETFRLLKTRSALHELCVLKLTEKKAIARNLIDILDQFGGKLEGDLLIFENELKATTDYEVSKSIPQNSEVSVHGL